jgi:hypothetical protein
MYPTFCSFGCDYLDESDKSGRGGTKARLKPTSSIPRDGQEPQQEPAFQQLDTPWGQMPTKPWEAACA